MQFVVGLDSKKNNLTLCKKNNVCDFQLVFVLDSTFLRLAFVIQHVCTIEQISNDKVCCLRLFCVVACRLCR